MSVEATAASESKGDVRVAVLLAMAMFVLVVDTSLMNVSISAVVRDLDATASGVQSAERQTSAVQGEILHINEEARPIALQIALLVPLIAALLGSMAGISTTRLPDPEPSADAETLLGG